MATKTASRTPGLDALERWMTENSVSQGALARTLGISQPSISEWLSGMSRPTPPLRKAVTIATGIPEDAWLTAEETAAVEEVRVRVAGAA